MIVSNDGANSSANWLGPGVVTIVPVTSNVERTHPSQVLLTAEATGLVRDSKARAGFGRLLPLLAELHARAAAKFAASVERRR